MSSLVKLLLALPIVAAASYSAAGPPRAVRERRQLDPSQYAWGGGGIDPYDQDGDSKWGTLKQSELPDYRSDGGTQTSYGRPWGRISTSNSNPYSSAPRTDNVRSYTLTLSGCTISPDGVATPSFCVNGQFPGPLIEANYGDILRITVKNNFTAQGTAVHFHGFLQTNNCQNDGVPGVQQCPIPPGGSYTYEMKAELYGSSWYHTHYSAQYAAGAVGPIVIYGPANCGSEVVDVGPVMLSEWYHESYTMAIKKLMRPLSKGGPMEVLANSNLINGKMRYDCSQTAKACKIADYAAFNFTSGKNHRLRLMNIGSAAVQKFSIDDHTMQVIALDYMPVKPYNVSVIALAVGQRADVIVYGSGGKGEKYWMRSNIIACSLNDGKLTEALGVIYYQGADMKSLPSAPANSGPAASTSRMSCANDPLTVTEPTFPLEASEPEVTKEFKIEMKSNGTYMHFYFGEESFMANFSDPILTHAVKGTTRSQPAQRNIWNIGTAKTARAIIYNYNVAPHPVHFHGHNMQILAIGMGPKWDGNIVRSSNPMRRDVQLMPPALSDTIPSHLVIQWAADNPGVWPLHCHFAWHSSMGFVAAVVEGDQQTIASSLPNAGRDMAGTCSQWAAWTKINKPYLEGLDSGL